MHINWSYVGKSSPKQWRIPVHYTLSYGTEPYNIIEKAVKRYRHICLVPGRSQVSSVSENHVDSYLLFP